MYIDSDLIQELRGLSYDEKLEIVSRNGYGYERKVGGGLLVDIPYNPNIEYRLTQKLPMWNREVQRWWDSLSLFEKLYWTMWRKTIKIIEYVRKRTNV